MKLYYVERANLWVVVGIINNAMVEAVAKQFEAVGLRVIFCDSFEKV